VPAACRSVVHSFRETLARSVCHHARAATTAFSRDSRSSAAVRLRAAADLEVELEVDLGVELEVDLEVGTRIWL